MTMHDLDMMDAEERRELLNAYLDGELTPSQALVVSQWLDSNPGALREVEHLRHLWDLLEQYGDEPVPETFASGVMDAVGIQREAQPEGGRVVQMAWYRRPMATAAAVLLAVGVTAFVMRDRDPVTPSPTPSPDNEVSQSVAQLEALGVEDLETLEYLHVIADADDETFEALVADESGVGG